MSGIVSPVAGTRTEPKDSYKFVLGTTATFKTIFTSDGRPTTVDVNTSPYIRILQPIFLNNGLPSPQTIATINGTLTPGQEFEYSFVWEIPQNLMALPDWIVQYNGTVGSFHYVFGDEYFELTNQAGQVDTQIPTYATVDDVRQKKFNIDDYLPVAIRKDTVARNNMIQAHLNDATQRLREELSLFKQRGMSQNYRLFCIYYTVWTLMLAARGEDGSSVSDQNLMFWRGEWERILAQEKRKSVTQSIPLGRG